jgi:galactose-1-phosphate uridylyltransferase
MQTESIYLKTLELNPLKEVKGHGRQYILLVVQIEENTSKRITTRTNNSVVVAQFWSPLKHTYQIAVEQHIRKHGESFPALQ